MKSLTLLLSQKSNSLKKFTKITMTLTMLLAFSFASKAQTMVTNGTFSSGVHSINILIFGATPGHTFFLTHASSAISVNYGSGTITANASGVASGTATVTVGGSQPNATSIDFTGVNISGGSNSSTSTYSFGAPIPVEFIGVTAEVSKNSVLINWSTASELNNEVFVIERSLDGETWMEIGTTPGAGTSNSIIEYAFIDSELSSTPSTFYRVKQIDFDGEFDYSDVVMVATELTKGQIVISPNPATSNSVTVKSNLEISNLEVRNIAGQLQNVDFNKASNQLDITNLESGMYYVTVNGDTFKLMK